MAAPIAIDASVVVRYLTGDDKAQSAAAAELFRAAQAGKVKLVIPASTIQETVYVLERLYNLDAATIAPKLISLLTLPNVDSPDAAGSWKRSSFIAPRTVILATRFFAPLRARTV